MRYVTERFGLKSTFLYCSSNATTAKRKYDKGSI